MRAQLYPTYWIWMQPSEHKWDHFLTASFLFSKRIHIIYNLHNEEWCVRSLFETVSQVLNLSQKNSSSIIENTRKRFQHKLSRLTHKSNNKEEIFLNLLLAI